MQKYILKQQFEGFTVSNSDGIHKGYERFQSLLSQLEIHGAALTTSSISCLLSFKLSSMDHEDLDQVDGIWTLKNGLKMQVAMYLHEDRRSSTRNSRRNYSLMQKKPVMDPGNKDRSITGKKKRLKTFGAVDGDKSYANLKRLYDAQREELSNASVEIKAYTQGLKKVEAQLVAHQQGQRWYEQKIKFMKIDLDDKTDVLTYHKKLLAKAQKEKDDLEVIVDKWNHSSKNLGKIVNSHISARDKFGLGYGDYRYSGILSYENEVMQSVFKSNESDFENLPLHKRLGKTCEMQAVPPPMTGNYLPSGPDIEIDDSQYTYGPEKTQPSESESQTTELDTCGSNISTEPSELVSEPVVNESNIEVQPKVWSDVPIIDIPHGTLKNKGIMDSGCSPGHMTGTGFTLLTFNDFMVGPVALWEIKREYSNARTPQQNRVAERKNKTLIEAARTMLADSFLPNTFWAEAVSTAFLCLNRKKMNLLRCFELPIMAFLSSIKTISSKPDKKRRGPREEEQVFLDDLARLQMQEKEANEEAEALRKDFQQETENLVTQERAAKSSSTNIFSTSGTNLVNTVSTTAKASGTNFVNTVSVPVSTAKADFTNLETVVTVSPIPTSRINPSHPSALILVMFKHREKSKDFHHCLFACFLSQHEPKKISEALEDESWVDAMQEELLQFEIQKTASTANKRGGTLPLNDLVTPDLNSHNLYESILEVSPSSCQATKARERARLATSMHIHVEGICLCLFLVSCHSKDLSFSAVKRIFRLSQQEVSISLAGDSFTWAMYKANPLWPLLQQKAGICCCCKLLWASLMDSKSNVRLWVQLHEHKDLH
ncbi:ribonuclease H-like domain-containing protein [Tanacetum coccineum]